MGLGLEGRLAASTSSKVARHQTNRERVLRNMLIRFDIVYTMRPLKDGLYNTSATEAMAEDRHGN